MCELDPKPSFYDKMDKDESPRSILVAVGVRKDRPKGVVAAKGGSGVLPAWELNWPRRGQ